MQQYNVQLFLIPPCNGRVSVPSRVVGSRVGYTLSGFVPVCLMECGVDLFQYSSGSQFVVYIFVVAACILKGRYAWSLHSCKIFVVTLLWGPAVNHREVHGVETCTPSCQGNNYDLKRFVFWAASCACCLKCPSLIKLIHALTLLMRDCPSLTSCTK